MKNREILGIDIGGSGIKGAPIDIKRGKLLAERHRIPTPIPADVKSVSEVIAELVKFFNWKGLIGVGFPAVVQNGIVKTASNIDHGWIGANAQKLFSDATGLPVYVVNDADAAGIAEMKFGAGKGQKGSILLVTVGTGIGTVLFSKKKLVPNTELGHLFLSNGIESEIFASDAARQNENLEWLEWADRFNIYLKELERLLWPELIIVGGGISKKPEKFTESIKLDTKVVMAELKNEAGIIGAAIAAKVNLKDH